ncbi:MAG: hypothetical protein HC888_07970, partial [Candidatus Competibacteraceae bacterium]|nr:hypothetical protein [Candidatus Competibacteraceae bacterium]
MDSLLPQGPKWFYDNDQKLPFGSVILGEGYLRRMDEWRDNMRSEAIRMHNLNPEVTEVQKYINFLQGNHWEGMNWPRYRNSFVNNMMDRARTDSISQLTSGKPTIDVQSSVMGYESSARIAMNVIHGEWVRQSFDLSLASLVDISLLWGTGFWRITSAKPGVMKMHAYGPDMVFPIRPEYHIQDSLAVLFKTYKGPEYFRRKFPMLSANIEREYFQPETPTMNQYLRPNSIAETTWNALSPGMRRVVGVRAGMDNTPNQKVFPVIELQEFT